jgi:uncharacterized membrane protein
VTIASLTLQKSLSETDETLKAKLLLLSFLLFGNFFILSLALRALNHASYMVYLIDKPIKEYGFDNDEIELRASEAKDEGRPSDKSDKELLEFRKAKVNGFLKMVKRSEIYFALSFRALFACIPLALWLSSSELFLASSIIVSIVLAINDHV